MEMRPQKEEEDLKLLYKAAFNGCITTLNTLVQEHLLILHRVSLSNFTETPLHISCLLGHLDFTIALLQQCPQMASERDSLHRLPIHLASAKGHAEILKALLFYDVNQNDACLARDEDRRIPLHVAAIRGRVDSVRVLVTTNPESVYELLERDTVFHLCVKYNRFEALKLLIEIVDDDVLLTSGNQDGNTILHLAAMLRKVEATRYLLTLTEVKEIASALNNKELTALDLLEQSPLLDFKHVEIRDILRLAGAKRAVELGNDPVVRFLESPDPSHNIKFHSSPKPKQKSWLEKCMKMIKYDREEIGGALMIVATVIATMSFQASINPPGGVWQQNSTDENIGNVCNSTNICEAGTSILAYAYPENYQRFLEANTYAFFGSLMVIALVVGGFPFRNKFCVWLLSQTVTITLICLSGSYVYGTLIVIPHNLREKMFDFEIRVLYVWSALISVAGLIEIVRFVVWIWKKSGKYWRMFKNKRSSASRIRPETPVA